MVEEGTEPSNSNIAMSVKLQSQSTITLDFEIFEQQQQNN